MSIVIMVMYSEKSSDICHTNMLTLAMTSVSARGLDKLRINGVFYPVVGFQCTKVLITFLISEILRTMAISDDALSSRTCHKANTGVFSL